MNRNKSSKPSSSRSSDSGSGDHSAAKKQKKASAKSSKATASSSKATASSSKATTSGNKIRGDPTIFELGGNRRASITQYKGKFYIDVREYYLNDAGEQKPGKRGIMLTLDQWEALKNIAPQLSEEVKKYKHL